MELLQVGGNANNGSQCGVAYSSSTSAFDVSGAHIGARLAFFGTPTIVSGSQLVAM